MDNSINYSCSNPQGQREEPICQHCHQTGSDHDLNPFRSKQMLRLLSGLGLFLVASLADNFLSPNFPTRYIIPLFGLSYLLVGWEIIINAFIYTKPKAFLDEYFLMTLATMGAFAIGAYSEAIAVMVFFKIGEGLQQRAVNHSQKSISSLLQIRPDKVRVFRNGNIQEVDPSTVLVGEDIQLQAGERIPLDGYILEGQTTVDTSALTGESLPRNLVKDDQVLAGMINLSGLIKVKVQKTFSQSTMAKILYLVKEAKEHKAPTEKFITTFARYYTPTVIALAVGIACGPIIFYHLPGLSFLFTEQPVFSDWLYRSLIFLVISCPCALVLSIPLGFFAGLGAASKKGILIKGANFLENLNKLATIVWDKTGTLTEGRFQVSQVNPAPGYTQKDILILGALAESNSSHPLAKAIVEAGQELLSAQDFPQEIEELSGRGVKAIVKGHKVIIGSAAYLDSLGFNPQNEVGRESYIHLAVDGEYAGWIEVRDQVRKTALDTIEQLKKLGVRFQYMLTGDNPSIAKEMSQNLGLSGYQAGLLPQEKVSRLENLIKQNKDQGLTAFVGDGINDAPVLARSDIGIAMGGLGADAAIEAADIVLMEDKPERLITGLKIARRTKIIVWENIVLAIGIKAFILGLGTLGLATMWGAVFADIGVTLLAVMNSLRILQS